jgi:tellurite resistance protein TerC
MDSAHVPLWVWATTFAVVAAVIATDLTLSRWRPRRPGLREAAFWTLGMIALAAAFGGTLAATADPHAAGQFFAGWLTEYSLSLDNLFIFVLLIGRSAVPDEYHGRVLLLGIVFALVLRGVFIALGSAALNRFGVVLYLFGAFLLYTAIRIAFERRPVPGAARGSLPQRWLGRLVRVAPEADGGRLTTRIRGRRYATPLLLLVVALAVTDLAFALDSIPAIFGLTRDPFLVFSANVFALLGLRHLYFLIGGLLTRLAHLSAGLSVILGFIGVKIISEALHESGVGRIGPLPVPHIGTGLSVAVIVGVLATVAVTSQLSAARSRPVPRPGQDEPGQDEPGQDTTGQDTTGQDMTGRAEPGQDRPGRILRPPRAPR